MSPLTTNVRKKSYAGHLHEIKALPFFSDDSCEISILTGGESHACYKVNVSSDAAEKRYFVKSLAEHYFTASTEVASQRLAAAAGLAPAVFYASGLWLVCDYIEGQSLRNYSAENINFSRQSKIAIAMNLMANTHQLNADSMHSVLDVTKLLTQQINQNHLTKLQQASLNDIVDKITNFKISKKHLVLCHGDVNDENIRLSQTFDKSRLTKFTWLVDFECSSLAEAEYDVAMYIAINQLPASEISQIIASYQQYSNRVMDYDKVYCYLTCCYLINGLWYFNTAMETARTDELLIKAHQQFMLFDQLELLKEKVVQLLC